MKKKSKKDKVEKDKVTNEVLKQAFDFSSV